ncbi:SDR family oxidoreductase [Arenimonas composti]|uniref:Uncharacterized protein n=1 Tax=Arenimonas composti TR7-09 = DSM 18010 TaxID=1121013 RepID=A0A091BCU9_9GAMM|nr:SDR family oxidoreductase [Arenimonas composti]KFN50468.1 hypothetical protein P873_07335 [Arenimonas composti TR7-09 = DSM 18010]
MSALLARGRPVIAVTPPGTPVPPPSPALQVVHGDTATETAAAALANAVRLLRRPPDAVVAVIGAGFTPGRLVDEPAATLQRKLDEDLFPHLLAARHLLPLLAERGAPAHWVLFGGPSADAPWAGYGQLSVAQAALRMLARVLREEMLATGVRVQQFTVCAPLRTADKQHCAGAAWPSPDEVALQVADLLAGAGTEPVVRYDRRRRALPAPNSVTR